MAALDVCLIPYVLNDYTRELSPIKLYEYLALGKSVVATNLPYLQREVDYITIAYTASEFIEAIKMALTDPASETEQIRRRNEARLFSWQDQVDQIEQILLSVMMEKAQ
jgi:glycosyltransferase involved in cell wall biosynthesis